MSQEQLIHASGSSGASPGESPYLNRITWASYKGLSRGQLGGLVLGGLIGLGVGAVAAAAGAAIMPALGLGALGTGTLAAVVAGFTAIGAKYYYDIFKQVGATSGAVAAGMEINEERSQVMNIKLDTILNVLAKDGKISPEEIKIIEDDVEAVYRQGAKDFEKKFHDKPAYFWQIGAVGALAGVAAVAALGGAGYLVHLMEYGAEHTAELVDKFSKPLAAVALGGGALAGASYGINRNYYRNVLNVTNALFEGNLAEIEMQRARQRGLAPEMELPDFTPVSKQAPAQATAPGTTISHPHAPVQMQGPAVMADAIAPSFSRWQELERARAEAALNADQRPTLH